MQISVPSERPAVRSAQRWLARSGPYLWVLPALALFAVFRLYPMAFGLYAFAVQVGNNPALTMAGSVIMTIPVIIIFFLAQKHFIQGVTRTGMKG